MAAGQVRLRIINFLMPPLTNRPAATKEIIDLLFSVKVIKETAISPDGLRLAWVEAQNNPDRTESTHSLIHVIEATDSKPRRVTAGDGVAAHSEKGLAWSPDGAWMAFLSDREKPKQAQLFVAPAAGGPAHRLTDLSGQMAKPQWAPDGRTIALLVIEGQELPSGVGAVARRDDGEVEERIYEQRLLLVEVATGRTRIISPADIYIYEYDWSPDGREIVYTGAPGSGENNYWLATLAAIDVASAKVREIYRPERQIAAPCWSPDGRTIAFIQGIMSDQGLTGGDIWSVPGAGGRARNLTPGRPSSPAWLKWLRQPDRLLFTEFVSGGAAISTLEPASGKTATLWRGDETLGTGAYDLTLSVAADGRASSVLRSSWARPPEVWSGEIGSWVQRTHINAGLQPLWGRAEKMEWPNQGHSVQGWLLYPRSFDAKQRYPMIVSIHGGPAAQRNPGWPEPGGINLTALASQGYFVFFPNPRGSYGQGEAFTLGNVKDFGHGDLRDIMAGVDHVLKVAPVDPDRLGVGGWSYGGYMTMWTVTQTERFRAAVAGAGIANWQSYYGQNMIDQWLIPYFGGSVYDDPEMYAKSSPIEYIKRVKTPTLIVAGDGDKACPAAQSYEFWHALKTLGVKTKLVIYAGEGHGLRQPVHIEDLFARLIGWYDEHLK